MTGLCDCLLALPNNLALVRWLGMDASFGEASIHVCPNCGQHWLRVHYEDEAFTASGRWYLGAVSSEQAAALGAEAAAAALEQLSWYYYGGSYYGGRMGKTSGKIVSAY